MIYGHGNTIHQTTHLDVEIDRKGRIVSVWFRCMLVPYQVTLVDDVRAEEMDAAYARGVLGVTAIEFAAPEA